MSEYTAQELLEAVGITAETGGTCHKGHRLFMGGEYTGPALGTPELDAILLVAGQRWLAAHQSDTPALNAVMIGLANQYGPKTLPFDESERLTHYKGKVQVMLRLLLHNTPGYALARAIKEVKK